VWNLVNKNIQENETLNIVDPAMGNGNLLFSFSKVISKEQVKNVTLSGFDLDSEAIAEADSRFEDLHFPTFFTMKDSIPILEKNNEDCYNVLVSNPPWGAKVNFTKEKLASFGYKTAVSQFDSYDLFIELSLKIVENGGYIAFVLPDSIFLEQHKQIRKKLLNETTLVTIYKLGEGFFDGVFRSTVLMIIRNEKPTSNHKIEVVILRKDSRNLIFSKNLSLKSYEENNKRMILQQQFIENDYTLNIEVGDERDAEIISAIESKIRVGEFFTLGRGIEVSKNGNFWHCNNCGYYQKKGKKELDTCPKCGSSIQVETIISKNETKGYIPMIAGEDFSRYSIPQPRYIRKNLSIINYKTKNLTNDLEKIIVRKTGLGITATLDLQQMHTNQVVFHLKAISENSPITLKALLGILNSRVMLFYHLKQSGETEWKSHPYITQSILRNIPLPNLEQCSPVLDRIDNLVNTLLTNGYSREVDLEIEKQVLSLYGLNTIDLRYMNDFIKGIDQLKVISKMVLEDSDLCQMNNE
jgi:adenine-specific DNA-methyltransferase